jgi:hypothetical protein
VGKALLRLGLPHNVGTLFALLHHLRRKQPEQITG